MAWYAGAASIGSTLYHKRRSSYRLRPATRRDPRLDKHTEWHGTAHEPDLSRQHADRRSTHKQTLPQNPTLIYTCARRRRRLSALGHGLRIGAHRLRLRLGLRWRLRRLRHVQLNLILLHRPQPRSARVTRPHLHTDTHAPAWAHSKGWSRASCMSSHVLTRPHASPCYPIITLTLAMSTTQAGGGGRAGARLVTAQVRVAHEVEREAVQAGRRRRGKFQLGALAPLQRHALDRQQRVSLRLADHQPPVLLLAPRVPARAAPAASPPPGRSKRAVVNWQTYSKLADSMCTRDCSWAFCQTTVAAHQRPGQLVRRSQ